MNTFCPNLRNKQVKQEFEALVDAVGEDAAYLVWHRNNGYALDSAPNGAESSLFKSLLKKYHGDYKLALQKKASFYLSQYTDENGKWYEGDSKENLDQNGEPMLRVQERTAKSNDKLFNLSVNDNHDLILKATDTKQALQSLVKDGYISDAFGILANVLSRHSIPIVISEENSDSLMSTYVDKNDGVVIAINPRVLANVSTGYAAYKLMHEVIHALTTNGLTKGSKIYNERLDRITTKMFETYSSLFPPYRFDRVNYRGFADKYEFVAEFMTNQEFRTMIFAKAEQLDKHNNNSTFLNRLKQFVKNIINFFVNKKSNTEQLQEYQLSLFKYLNDKNAIVNGNIKSEQQLKNLLNSVDTFKHLTEGIIENDEYSQRLLSEVQRHDFILGWIDKKIHHSAGYQTRRELRSAAEATAMSAEYKRVVDIKKSPSVIVEGVVSDIIQMLETRTKAVKVSKLPDSEKQKIINGLQAQISALKSDTTHRVNAIAYTLASILPEVIENSEKVHDAAVQLYRDGKYVLDDADYMYMQHDYFGVYQSLLGELQDFFAHPAIQEYMGGYKADKLSLLQNLDDFVTKINICKNLCDTSVSTLDNLCSANVIARFENLGLETGCESDMQTYINEHMGGCTNQDVSDIAKLFGSLDQSADYSLRALSFIVNKALITASRNTNAKAAKLIMLQHNLKSGESHIDLYEKDDKGLPTGYLVRRLNYGKFKKDYDEFMRKLNAKYSTEEEPLAPDNRIAPTNQETRVKWSVERNNWLGKHCHRRFKAEYYNKFAQLSNVTKQRRDEIQSAINVIRSSVLSADGTYYDYNALTDEQWEDLKKLYMQRRQLACVYDVSGELKQGDDLLVAQEVSALNKSLYDGNKAKRNEERWRASRDKIIAECGGIEEMNKGRTNDKFDWKKLDKWDERNSKKQFTLDDDGNILLFEDIRKAKIALLEKSGFTDAQIENLLNPSSVYHQNKERINKMLAPYRRLDNGDVDATILPEQIKQKVVKLQEENKKILKKEKESLKKQIKRKLSEVGKEYYDVTWTQQFADMLSEVRKADVNDAFAAGINPDEYDNPKTAAFLRTHGFLKLIDYGDGMFDEKFTPYNFYTKIVPKDQAKYMTISPGDNYIEQDPESSFLDLEFDLNENETFVPMESGTYEGKSFSYSNKKAYDKIKNSKTLSALYDGIKDTIAESNEIYSNIPYKNPYQLPGITGSTYRSFIKASKTGKWGGVFKNRFGRLFKKTEQDLDFEKSAATRPDGKQLSFIQQPFTAALKDPSEISMDLVGITMMYYAHAQQYKEKTKIKDQCESILDVIERRRYNDGKKVMSGVETNIYQQGRKFIDRELYSQVTTPIEIAGLNVNKVFGIAKAWATAVNLGCSIKVATVGALSAEYAHLMNAITGRDYGVKDWMIGHWEMLSGLLSSGFGARIIGNNSRLFQQNVMELFNIADQGEKKYKNTNRNAVVNQLTQNWCFGLLTASDYLVKGSILDTTLAAHRYFRGEFLSRDDIQLRYGDKNSINGGEECQKMLDEWSKGKTMLQLLKEAHRKGNRENMFNIPSEYKDAYEKSFMKISKRAENVAARADGVMTPTQRAAFMSGMVGQAVMMHKQYLQPMIQHYWGAKRYNMETQQWQYGTVRCVIDMILRPYIDGINAVRLLNDSKNPDANIGFLKKAKTFGKAFVGSTKTQAVETIADPINRKTVKKLIAEIAIYNLLVYPLVSMLLKKADDDKDNLLLQLVAYVAIAARWEAFTPYRFADILNTIKSPTAMTSVWDGLNNLADGMNSYKTPENSLWSMFSNVSQAITSEDGDTLIKRGAYKGNTHLEKALWKLTPFKNLKEQWYGSYDKRKYAANQLYKQKD